MSPKTVVTPLYSLPPAQCGICRHWDTKHHDNAYELGMCRRHPPTLASDSQTGVWPRTGKHDWCGAFEQR